MLSGVYAFFDDFVNVRTPSAPSGADRRRGKISTQIPLIWTHQKNTKLYSQLWQICYRYAYVPYFIIRTKRPAAPPSS